MVLGAPTWRVARGQRGSFVRAFHSAILVFNQPMDEAVARYVALRLRVDVGFSMV